MTQHLESNFSIRNLLANNDGTNPALTPPLSDRSMSPNEDIRMCGSRPNFIFFFFQLLVSMALRSSPEGKLTLGAIQNWISDNFPYYRKDEQGWQNQIRHTLSTNSCFQKIPRPMSDPKRGHYWAISPEVETLQTPVAASSETVLGTMVNGVPHPQAPNAVYFPTPREVHSAHRTLLTQALQEQHACYKYHLQQTHFLQQQLVVLQQQHIHQQYQEVYHELAFHEQQIAFLAAQNVPV